ncbi:Na-translocating system protein MpsC family protein [Halobacillus massiliensis]|uniref:Na-translocating system protein MpsC family protein n=1 Tax=Halobacillus massiliensis TaxID=1926286 RepID=UPI0009E3760F|nr:Na-translocating system protein MpsC family protein [Halobacillus massiliensis]
MEVREQQTKMANNFGKLLRDKFGKGPQAIHVTISPPYVLIYLSGFVSATEQVLLEQEQELTVKTTREYVMKSLEPEILGQIKGITDLDIQQIYYDWNLANQTGCIVGVSSEKPEQTDDYPGKQDVHKEISWVSEQAEKAPAHVDSHMVSSRAIIVIREGILVPIEKQLISFGFDENLRVAKRQLEGELLLNNTHFAEIFKTEVQDVFVDWDFARDDSVIAFILKPNKK